MVYTPTRQLLMFGLVILLISSITSCVTPGSSQVTNTIKEAAPTNQPTQHPSATEPSHTTPEANSGQKKTPPVSNKQPQGVPSTGASEINNEVGPTQNPQTSKQGVTIIEVNPNLNQAPTAGTVPGADGAPGYTQPSNSETYTSPPSQSPTNNQEINIAELEIQIHNLTNTERTKQGLSPLSWDAQLNIVARKHSEDMARRNYFNHTSPEGFGPADRCKQAGLIIQGCAENIFQCTLAKADWYKNGVLAYTEYYTQKEIASLVVNSWMNSPGHRQNILAASWTSEGVGIGISSDGKVYITQDFS